MRFQTAVDPILTRIRQARRFALVPATTRRFALVLVAVCVASMICLPDVAFAGTAGVGMPYEGPLNRILASLTGPVAMTMSIVGVTLAGIGLIFGGTLDGFFKMLINMAFAISIVFGAATLITNVFGGSGAEISDAIPAPAAQPCLCGQGAARTGKIEPAPATDRV